MIDDASSPSGNSCDGSATRPSAAATADNPSSSGTPAATSAPKASTRMISVIGSESVSAFLKSSSNAFESALFADAAPNSPTKTDAFAFWTRSTAASTGTTDVSAAVSSPRSLKFTRTEPSSAICPSLPLA